MVRFLINICVCKALDRLKKYYPAQNISMLKCMETFLKYFIHDHHVVDIKTAQTIIVVSNKV